MQKALCMLIPAAAKSNGRVWLKTLRIMKLTCILLTAAFLHAAAAGSAQNVTLRCKETPLQEVIKQIELQTTFTFFYKTSVLAAGKPVTLELQNVPVETALEKCFSNQSLTYAIQGRIIAIKPKPVVAIQDKHAAFPGPGESFLPPVTGRITDSTGVPLAGVSLIVRGRNRSSTTTDSEGRFSLTVSAGDVIVITHIGYESKEIKVTSATTAIVLSVTGQTNRNSGAVLNIASSFTISLAPFVSSLEEVAVISNGYQELPREGATGAIQVVNTKALQQQTGTNILQRLNNIATGVWFDTRPIRNPDLQKVPVTIRGLSSINGPLDPLIVLNGFIYEGNIDNIDPNLVDNVTILKDAAATAIWGARAGNGVIIITTKKGKAGKKPEISFSTSTMVKAKPDLHDVYQVPSEDYISIEEMLFQNNYYKRQLNQWPPPPLSAAVEVFLERRNGTISAADSATRINALKQIDARDQYAKYFLDHPLLQQYALSVSGGSTTNTYGVSMGYTDDRDAYDAVSRKVNVALSNSYRPNQRFSLDVSAYYTNSNSTTGRPEYSTMRVNDRIVPYLEFADEQGEFLSLPPYYSKAFTDTFMQGKLLNLDYYPLEDYKHQYTKGKLEELYGNIGIQYALFPFLKLDLAYQYQQQKFTTEQTSDPQSFFSRYTVNLYSSVDPFTGQLQHAIPPGGIKMLNESTVKSSTLRGQLNSNYQWGLHDINAIAGAEVREARQQGYSFTAYGYTDDPLRSVPVDYVNGYPLIDGGYGSITGAPEFLSTINRFVSLYTSIIYTYNKRYSLSASARRDGANIFGQKSNDKWKPLWSVGAGWNLHEESFYRLRWLTRLRLRISYGYSGNVDLRKTSLPVGAPTSGLYTNYPAIIIDQLNDPYLRWEKNGIFNIGVDFSIRNGIVDGSAEYYRKRGRDLYGNTFYDYTTWGMQSFITKNVGGMKGSGLELTLNCRAVQGAFSWNPGLLLTVSKNKVAEYYDAYSDWETNLVGDGSTIMPVIGKPLYAIAAYRWAGLDAQGNPQGYLNGVPSTDYVAMRQAGGGKGLPDNFVYMGSATPEIFGAVINRFAYKSLSLAVNISFKGAYYFRNPSTSFNQLFSRGVGYADLARRWRMPGDEKFTNTPSLVYPVNYDRESFYNSAEINVHRADHIRLEYINLSYSFQNLFNKKVSTLEVYANAANLGILWKANKVGVDPDYVNRMRPLASLTGGIRATF